LAPPPLGGAPLGGPPIYPQKNPPGNALQKISFLFFFFSLTPLGGPPPLWEWVPGPGCLGWENWGPRPGPFLVPFFLGFLEKNLGGEAPKSWAPPPPPGVFFFFFFFPPPPPPQKNGVDPGFETKCFLGPPPWRPRNFWGQKKANPPPWGFSLPQFLIFPPFWFQTPEQGGPAPGGWGAQKKTVVFFFGARPWGGPFSKAPGL